MENPRTEFCSLIVEAAVSRKLIKPQKPKASLRSKSSLTLKQEAALADNWISEYGRLKLHK